jgi:hypothetical protein
MIGARLATTAIATVMPDEAEDSSIDSGTMCCGRAAVCFGGLLPQMRLVEVMLGSRKKKELTRPSALSVPVLTMSSLRA